MLPENTVDTTMTVKNTCHIKIIISSSKFCLKYHNYIYDLTLSFKKNRIPKIILCGYVTFVLQKIICRLLLNYIMTKIY